MWSMQTANSLNCLHTPETDGTVRSGCRITGKLAKNRGTPSKKVSEPFRSDLEYTIFEYGRERFKVTQGKSDPNTGCLHARRRTTTLKFHKTSGHQKGITRWCHVHWSLPLRC